MYGSPYMYQQPYPYDVNSPMYNYGNQSAFSTMPYGMAYANQYNWPHSTGSPTMRDHGKQPFVVNIHQVARHNRTFRTTIWTGRYLQVVLMSINVGEDIGLEVHPALDQFLRIEDGQGLVQMGDSKKHLYFQRSVQHGDAIMVPAGTWHNLINTGNTPIKLYTIYAPPEHPFGTVHRTKAEAMASEENHH